MSTSQKQSGFTIVELLIVIVVIGILAAISIAAYSGIQARVRDAQRKSDFANIAKAFGLYTIDKNSFISVGGGASDGTGWYNGGSPTLPQSLQAAGFLTGPLMQDPKCGSTNTAGCPGYLNGICGSGSTAREIIFGKLESSPSIALPAELSDCSANVQGWWSSFGSNYYKASS